MSNAVRELFEPLNNRDFETRDQLEQAIKREFAKHRGRFGPDYSLYQLLRWSYQQGWIREVQGGKYFISVESAKQLSTA